MRMDRINYFSELKTLFLQWGAQEQLMLALKTRI